MKWVLSSTSSMCIFEEKKEGMEEENYRWKKRDSFFIVLGPYSTTFKSCVFMYMLILASPT
jgi:hypothetical protein